ncbi:MAG: DNA polymerase III subunit delta [Burkholderiaceae bacterium]|nr:MAG: DNA polymerase III subunit delta [Burkholderiaceae bacterium]
MQLKPDQLPRHLTQSLAPLYVVTGDEHLLVQETVDSLRAAARAQGFSEREALTVAAHFDWGQLQVANQSLSLFGERKLIELRIPSGKPGKEGSQALQQYVSRLHGDTLTLISLPRLDRATRDGAWFGALAQHGVVIEIPVIERAQLPQWIAARLAQQQQSANIEALDFIAARVEGNLLAAHQEIQKLALLYPTGELSTAQVHDAVLNVARYDVFKLSEAMLSGDTARVTHMLDGLRGEGEAPVLVLWAITEEIRTLARIQQGKQLGRPLPQLLREHRVWGARERLVPVALGRISFTRLRLALGRAAQLDRAVKGLKVTTQHTDVWVELERLALAMC